MDLYIDLPSNMKLDSPKDLSTVSYPTCIEHGSPADRNQVGIRSFGSVDSFTPWNIMWTVDSI